MISRSGPILVPCWTIVFGFWEWLVINHFYWCSCTINYDYLEFWKWGLDFPLQLENYFLRIPQIIWKIFLYLVLERWLLLDWLLRNLTSSTHPSISSAHDSRERCVQTAQGKWCARHTSGDRTAAIARWPLRLLCVSTFHSPHFLNKEGSRIFFRRKLIKSRSKVSMWNSGFGTMKSCRNPMYAFVPLLSPVSTQISKFHPLI